MSTHLTQRAAIDRTVVTNHRIEAPLDWTEPERPERITVFAREVVAAEKKDDANNRLTARRFLALGI
jgi:hypothetical protein